MSLSPGVLQNSISCADKLYATEVQVTGEAVRRAGEGRFWLLRPCMKSLAESWLTIIIFDATGAGPRAVRRLVSPTVDRLTVRLDGLIEAGNVLKH